MCDLEWSGVTCALADGRHLLKNVSGQCRRGEVTAILGPSGAGKSTLLSAIAGQLPQSKGLTLNGRLSLNGLPASPADVRVAFVKQEDAFFSMMTVRETLRFHTTLRTGGTHSLEVIEAKVDALMSSLGLTKSAHTYVGDASSSGRSISGGERKRLSIACELIAEPPIVLLDEPTSGLDSFQAANVVSRLHAIARAGRTVLLTIHQPSSQLFGMLDRLVILAEGRSIYSGPRSGAAACFPPRDPRVSEPEHYLELASVDHESAEAEELSRARIERLASAMLQRSHEEARARLGSPLALSAAATTGLALGFSPARASTALQLRLLLERSWRQVFRARGVLVVKGVQQVVMALIYGGIYTLDLSARSAQDRLGLLSLVVIGGANMGLAGTIRTFPRERRIVMDEQAKALYSIGPYFVSKLAADVPIAVAFALLFGSLIYPAVGLQPSRAKFGNFLELAALNSVASSAVGLLLGSVARSTDAALALLPPTIVLLVIFNGFNINSESVPLLLRWLPSVSLVRWAFEGMSVNEMSGLVFTPAVRPGPKLPRWHPLALLPLGRPPPLTGESILAGLSFGQNSVQACMRALALIICCCWLGSLCALQLQRSRRSVQMREAAEPGQ